MNIDSVSSQNVKESALYKSPTKQKLEKQAEIVQSDKNSNSTAVDTFVKGKSTGATDAGIYSKPSQKSVNALIDDANRRTEEFRQMILSMLTSQDGAAKIVNGKVQVSAEVAAKAKASISEGGEYSVDAVATRIMDMAKALSGGDESKIAVLREAVEKGFGAAAGKMGGKLTDISSQTYDEVMKRFDDWASAE